MKENVTANEWKKGVAEPDVSRHYGLVIHTAKKFLNTGVKAEELISIGSIGLMKALWTYDSRRGILLSTYACRCMENEILQYLRYIRKFQKEVSLEEVLYRDPDGNQFFRSDGIGTDPDSVSDRAEERMEINMLKQAVRRLPPQERRIICLRYGMHGYELHEKKIAGKEGGRTQREVSWILGVSQSYISRMERKALRRLRDELEGRTEASQEKNSNKIDLT